MNSGPDGYRLDDEGVQQAVADFSQRVVSDFGFDGVFLNVEPVWNGDENFLSLVRGVRAAVGIDTLVSVAAPPDWSPANADIPVPPLIVPGTEWDDTYKRAWRCSVMKSQSWPTTAAYRALRIMHSG